MRDSGPTRPPHNPSAVSSNSSSSTALEIPVTLKINGQITEATALIDSGVAKTHNIPLVPYVSHLAVAALNGRLLGTGRIQFPMKDIQLCTGALHTKCI